MPLKDLDNIRQSMSEGITESVLKDTVYFLKNVDDAEVQVLIDDERLEGIYFQTARMKDSFDAFPELLLCDATYKLNNLNLPLYIFLVINVNGQGEVAASFLLANETGANLRQMCQIFKSNNEKWNDIQSITTDKDFTERHAFKAEFPCADLLLCLFHTLKTFKRNITIDRMSISSSIRNECLVLLQKMAFSEGERDYTIHYEALKNLKVDKVLNYFNDNWHNISVEWIKGLIKEK